MIHKLPGFRLSEAQEDDFRRFSLQSDVRQAKLGILMFLIPIATFVLNDFRFFGVSTELFGLLALRIGLLCSVTGVFIFVSKVKSYNSYDKAVFWGSFVLMIGGGIINSSRPQNFMVQAIITIVSVFVLYLVIPFKFSHQVTLSSITTIGEALIIGLVLKPSDYPTLLTLLLSLGFANIIAALSSWQIQSYRRRSFQDYVKQKEMQDSLEQHSKHLEELVADRTEKLRSSEHLAAIGATAGMVGHDIRNPLTAITGAVYLAKNKLKNIPDGDAKDSLKKNLDLITEQTIYVNKIVADLQDYARPLKPSLEETDLERTVQSALSTLTVPENIIVEVSIEKQFPKLKTDPTYLQRIITNLSNNGLQAMPEGGKLAIKAVSENGKARIIIEDTGEGIPKETRDKLFTPLFTTKAKGQGFGLAVIKRLTEALGGTVELESEVGKGTKFIIELPLNFKII
jgi:signal transduction histidine kinase